MGYRIQYDGGYSKEELAAPKKRRPTALVGAIIVILIVVYALYAHADTLQKMLLPGDPAITEEAVTAFSENVKGGVPVGEAFTAFCIEILEGAV